MNRNELIFDKKFPGIRRKIIKFLTRELRNLKKIGLPDYDLINIATSFTKNIINILEDAELALADR